MVRTVATVIKAAGGRSSKASAKKSSSSNVVQTSSGSSSDRSSIGGNSVCPRETPKWQKPITNFFDKSDKAAATSSTNNELMDCDVSNEKDTTAITVENESLSQKITVNNKTDDYSETTENINGHGTNDQNVNIGAGCSKSNSKTLNDNKENERGSINSMRNLKINTVKENEMNESRKNSRNEDDEELDLAPAKRQKIDFYKHLESIEMNAD